jgi:hypothetical protein
MNELRGILKSSLLGTVGLMWVIGGGMVVWTVFGIHWALGWLALFVWIWGCWAGALYFDVKRYLSFDV